MTIEERYADIYEEMIEACETDSNLTTTTILEMEKRLCEKHQVSWEGYIKYKNVGL